jgi:hypothetical protein
MAPIDDREFGGLERQVDIDHESVVVLFAKMDKLTDKLAGYMESHGDEHRIIHGQLGGLPYLWAIVLLALGAAATAIFKG